MLHIIIYYMIMVKSVSLQWNYLNERIHESISEHRPICGSRRGGRA